MNTNTQTTDYQRIAQAIQFIVESFPTKPDLKTIADQIYLSEYHFQRLFSQWAGISPKKFQQYLTLSFAKECLKLILYILRIITRVEFQLHLQSKYILMGYRIF